MIFIDCYFFLYALEAGTLQYFLFFVFLGVLGGCWGFFLWYMCLLLFRFAGIFASESKGTFLVFFKILIISFVLCVKTRYVFCHVFVFLGT